MPVPGDGPRVGILGGGQLARMLALAGAPLGLRFTQLTPDHDAASGLLDTIRADYDDERALRALAERADVVTYESENIPVPSVELLSGLVPVRPGARALAVAGDRWAEKELFARLDIPTVPFARIAHADDVEAAIAHIGLPCVLKMRRFGYDGRGQAVCQSAAEARRAFDRLGGVPLLGEAWIPFERELSIVAARAGNGSLRCYPLAENTHENGILRATMAPAPTLTPQLTAAAEHAVRRIAEDLDYVGVLALELFQHDGRLLANELAPRVHNTGHWTIEGAQTSQFENHLRAILGWPLGGSLPYGHWIMVNLIGAVPPLPSLLEIEDTHVHLYAKAPRPGRKLGHITAAVDTADEGAARIDGLRRITDAAGTHA